MEGSRVEDGFVGASGSVEAEECEAAHSKSAFVRLSMLMKNDRQWSKILNYIKIKKGFL
jgi:hypothetical protein